MSRVRTRILQGFDDPSFPSARWQALLQAGPTDTIFLTHPWQRAWWESFGRGRLLLIVAERDGEPVALAPLFAEAGMVFFVGSGGSDYLDFVGDVAAPGVLEALLAAARAQVDGFLGFRFYLVPDDSPTGPALRAAAAAAEPAGLACFDEGCLPAPVLELTARPEEASAATRKQSLLRHERHLARTGDLAVTHLSDGGAILPHLPEFFRQHIARWEATPHPSLFLDPAQQAFYERLCRVVGPAGWLRFTRVDWNGQAVAFHFGACYRQSFLWYKPSFDVGMARRSPGEVLLRQLLLAAIGEGADTFDFGIGDEAFKARFATRVRQIRTWGLYPAGAAPAPSEDAGA